MALFSPALLLYAPEPTPLKGQHSWPSNPGHSRDGPTRLLLPAPAVLGHPCSCSQWHTYSMHMTAGPHGALTRKEGTYVELQWSDLGEGVVRWVIGMNDAFLVILMTPLSFHSQGC